jgi:hypothetical protein
VNFTFSFTIKATKYLRQLGVPLTGTSTRVAAEPTTITGAAIRHKKF